MYSIIRLIFGCILFYISIPFIRKNDSPHKSKRYFVSATISFVFAVISLFLPIENFFMTFKSAESAYDYYDFGKSDVELVVNGSNCDFVVSYKNEAYEYLIVPHTKDGWKIGITTDTKKTAEYFENGISVQLYKYKNTSDYFVAVLNSSGNIDEIFDSNNSSFITLTKQNDVLNKSFTTYYAHISAADSDYCITVNGNKINLIPS